MKHVLFAPGRGRYDVNKIENAVSVLEVLGTQQVWTECWRGILQGPESRDYYKSSAYKSSQFLGACMRIDGANCLGNKDFLNILRV